MDKTIFVNIASYKDPELENTVTTLLARAKNPKNISVAICQQDYPEQLKLFLQPQVRTINYHAVDSQGVCWARRQAQNLYNGQDYFLQIDSHIIMIDNWDEVLIDQINQARLLTNNKVIFSAYPSGYRLVNGQRTFDPPMYERTLLRNDNIFRFHCGMGRVETLSQPVPSPYLNAGFMFGDGDFNRLCLYDTDIYFEGEELLNTVKAYTNGFDIFNPNAHMCWHLYKLWHELEKSHNQLHHFDKDDEKRTVRHWERSQRSHDKLVSIFSGQMPQELGTVRTIQDYEAYIGRSILK